MILYKHANLHRTIYIKEKRTSKSEALFLKYYKYYLYILITQPPPCAIVIFSLLFEGTSIMSFL